MLDWIETSGGPLVLMESKLSVKWGGVSGSNSKESVSDYDYACNVDEYIEKVPYDSGEIVVFGDEPDRTTYIPISEACGVFVRWKWSNTRDIQDLVLEKFNELRFMDSIRIKYTLNSDSLYLFDSSVRGSEINEKLEINLPKGEYELSTEIFEPDIEIRLVLHRIYRIS